MEPAEGSDGTDGRWRIAQNVASDRVISTVDPDARHAHKSRYRRQDGFKAHLAVEPDTGIITGCALTKASGRGIDGQPITEARTGLQLLEAEPEQVRVLADSAYGSGEFRAELKERGHVDLVKPAPSRAAVDGGFTVDDFTIDHTGGSVTCPAGVTRRITSTGRAVFKTACRGCPLRDHCTTSPTGRTLMIRPHDALQRAARRNARNPECRTSIDNTGRWSSALSPGWPAATADFAIAAWPKTSTGCTTGPRR